MGMHYESCVFYMCCGRVFERDCHKQGTAIIHIIRCPCKRPVIKVKTWMSSCYGGLGFVALNRFKKKQIEDLRSLLRNRDYNIRNDDRLAANYHIRFKHSVPLNGDVFNYNETFPIVCATVGFKYASNVESSGVTNVIISEDIPVNFNKYYYRFTSIINDSASYKNYGSPWDFPSLEEVNLSEPLWPVDYSKECSFDQSFATREETHEVGVEILQEFEYY